MLLQEGHQRHTVNTAFHVVAMQATGGKRELMDSYKQRLFIWRAKLPRMCGTGREAKPTSPGNHAAAILAEEEVPRAEFIPYIPAHPCLQPYLGGIEGDPHKFGGLIAFTQEASSSSNWALSGAMWATDLVHDLRGSKNLIIPGPETLVQHICSRGLSHKKSMRAPSKAECPRRLVQPTKLR